MKNLRKLLQTMTNQTMKRIKKMMKMKRMKKSKRKMRLQKHTTINIRRKSSIPKTQEIVRELMMIKMDRVTVLMQTMVMR